MRPVHVDALGGWRAAASSNRRIAPLICTSVCPWARRLTPPSVCEWCGCQSPMCRWHSVRKLRSPLTRSKYITSSDQSLLPIVRMEVTRRHQMSQMNSLWTCFIISGRIEASVWAQHPLWATHTHTHTQSWSLFSRQGEIIVIIMCIGAEKAVVVIHNERSAQRTALQTLFFYFWNSPFVLPTDRVIHTYMF